MATKLWKIRYRNLLSALTPQIKLFYLYNNPCRSNIGFSIQRQTFSTVSNIHDSEEKDVRERSSEIFKAMQSKEVNMYSENEFTLLYQYLLDLGIKNSTIEAQFLETPDLGKYSLEKWKKVCTLLTKNGVPSESVFRNIALFPNILTFNSNLLEQHVKIYSEMHIGRQSILQIVQRNPHLYVFPPKTIRKRMTLLSAMFPPAELKNLIKNNPDTLTDNWDTISKKIMYIHEVMGLEQPHIAASESLQKSLLHIKTRHQFLYRAGLYITPNLLRDKQSAKRNPHLSLIMDTSKKYFVNKIARLTDYEYDVFSIMMKEEHDSMESEEDDELTDSDDLHIDSFIDSQN